MAGHDRAFDISRTGNISSADEFSIVDDTYE